MRSIFIFLLAAGGLAAAALPASATPITGNITFGGTFIPTVGGVDSANLATATGFDFAPTGPGGVLPVNGTNGNLATFAGATGTITDFTFTPFSPIVDFYTVVSGGETLTFDLESITIEDQTPTFLSMSGTGILNLTGFDPTAGVFNLTGTMSGNDPTVIFAFSAGSNNVAAVPEPASGAILGFGMLGLTGMYWRRRKNNGA
jgi:hypothetical protein